MTEQTATLAISAATLTAVFVVALMVKGLADKIDRMGKGG
jgi:hypothetical protein